ncbi:MAG: response regulator transcription factor [Chloroflexi bacterium]|nr:response regulator transcription factor [Chloroflexota bacterium]
MNKKVLVIDDDPDLGKLVEAILKPIDLMVFQACSGSAGLKKAYEVQPDIVILDVMMPGLNGFDVCTRLREMAGVPILMLTARGNPSDVLHGFNVGADDYIKKPFNKDEFTARVCALLRRSSNHTGSETSNITNYTDNLLHINLESQSVELAGNILELSPTEYSLLACLVRNMGKIVPHRQIFREVWGSTYGDISSTLTLYIYYLRKKLEDSKHGHQYIHTQWGRGYLFLPRQTDR